MTSLTFPRTRSVVLTDLLPAGRVRDVIVVVAGAGLIGLAAQIAVPLPFTPVPITLQTLAVLLAGAALGPARGLATTTLYLVAGGAGVPWFTDASSGWGGASFGYIIGFVLAGTVAGWLARQGGDRQVVPTFAGLAIADLTVYLVGVPWLMAVTHVSFGTALSLGFTPFVIGDAVKIACAASALPGAWRLIGSGRDRHELRPTKRGDK